jgi:hypothetical protein
MPIFAKISLKAMHHVLILELLVGCIIVDD